MEEVDIREMIVFQYRSEQDGVYFWDEAPHLLGKMRDNSKRDSQITM